MILFVHVGFTNLFLVFVTPPQLPDNSSSAAAAAVGEGTPPTNPRFNLPSSRMIKGLPSPSGSSNNGTPSQLGGGPSSLASSSSSDQTMSESSTSTAHDPPPPPRSLFPPGPSRPSNRTGLTRPTSGSNMLSQGLGGGGGGGIGGKGQRGSISVLLSKSNPGKAGNKPQSLPLKNDTGGKLSSHPLVSPQNSSRFRLPSSSGTPLFHQGGGRLGGNLISSRLVEKRGSASSSGSSSSSRQTSLEFPPVNSAAKSLRKRCNTEPISPYLKSEKSALRLKPRMGQSSKCNCSPLELIQLSCLFYPEFHFNRVPF